MGIVWLSIYFSFLAFHRFQLLGLQDPDCVPLRVWVLRSNFCGVVVEPCQGHNVSQTVYSL